MVRNGIGTAGAAIFALGLLACDGSRGAEHPVAPELAEVVAPSLMPCPASAAEAETGSVGTAGGALHLGDHVVQLPPQAVLGTTMIRLTDVPGPYLMVDLRANLSEHWRFNRSLTITLDYSRCPAESLARGPLSVWLVDVGTGELLEPMGGTDDRANRRITFQTDHFSGYAIAN